MPLAPQPVHRVEIVAERTADPRTVDALERAFTRMMEGEPTPIREVEVGEREGRLLVRMELAVATLRRARRRGERILADAWYDAFGERGPMAARRPH